MDTSLTSIFTNLRIALFIKFFTGEWPGRSKPVKCVEGDTRLGVEKKFFGIIPAVADTHNLGHSIKC